MKVTYITADVFTAKPFGGNPVAVIPDATGLTTGQMQQIAMEFNLSETTFVLPPRDPANTAEVRIFTPRQEIPFAGHPNIGTAFVLANAGECHGRAIGEGLIFEEKAGLVEIELIRNGPRVRGARLSAPQAFSQGGKIPAEIVATACSLPVEAITADHHAPCLASCGLPMAFAELETRAALAAASPRTDVFSEHLPPEKAGGLLLYTKSETEGIDFHARMFAPLFGVPEDPATGSANVTLIGLLAAIHRDADLELRRIIWQGEDMGRPSMLTAEATKRNGEVISTRIAGECVPMMEGALEI